MSITSKLKKEAKKVVAPLRSGKAISRKVEDFSKRFETYSFQGEKCIDARQYEAVITRWYHTVEKGLSYVNYRAGFGRDSILQMLATMENYVSDGFDVEAFFYKTALSALHQYIEKNHANGQEDKELEERINRLKGTPNDKGGAFFAVPPSEEEVKNLGYKDFALSRHSFRHFSNAPVDLKLVQEALTLAQHTPSACNRQGWKARVINDKSKIKSICDNQNGNRGFGQEFDMMILVTGDLRCFNRSREIFQVYIDGGMYAENILNALHYYHIASVPLSASLTEEQEKNVRLLVGMHEAEVPIMLIGIGNYPIDEECLVAKSERKPPEFEVIE